MTAEQQQIEKPKRAKSAYFLFCEEHRPAAMEANRAKNSGKLKMGELGKELSELWSKVDATEKARFEAQATKEKAEHEVAMKEYAESQKIDGLMKKPQCAYFQFINANRERITKEYDLTGFGAVGKKASELWNKMTEDEKKPYYDKYEKDKTEYEAWKETPEGKEALAKLKDKKKEKKRKHAEGDADEAEQNDDGGEDEAVSPPKKMKVAKVAKEAKPTPKKTPAVAAKLKKTTMPQLSAAIVEKCMQMGTAESGSSYKGLMEKILATDGLAQIDQGKALTTLQKHGGLLNKARCELLGGA